MATKFYYVGYYGKSELATHGYFTKQTIVEHKKKYLTAPVYKKADAFYEYLRQMNFPGDHGLIMDEHGVIVVRWKRTPSVWGAQYFNYKKPF